MTKGHKKDQSNALVDDNGNQETTLLDAMPDEIFESVVDEMDRSPLSLISDHSVVEEMLSSNPDVNDWMSALADMQEIIDEDEPEIKSMLESEMVNEIPNQELELLSQMESQAETGFEENEMNHDQDEAQTSQTEVIQSTSNNNEMKIQLHESDASADYMNQMHQQFFACYKQT